MIITAVFKNSRVIVRFTVRLRRKNGNGWIFGVRKTGNVSRTGEVKRRDRAAGAENRRGRSEDR